VRTMKSQCTSRPDCPCAFCVRARTEPSKRDKLDQMAREWMIHYISLREDRWSTCVA
jgi:hypothetical protein